LARCMGPTGLNRFVHMATIRITPMGALHTAIGARTISWAVSSSVQGRGFTAGTVMVGTTAGGMAATAFMDAVVITAVQDTAMVAQGMDTGAGLAGRGTAIALAMAIGAVLLAAMPAAGSTAVGAVVSMATAQARSTAVAGSMVAVEVDSTVVEAAHMEVAGATAADTAKE